MNLPALLGHRSPEVATVAHGRPKALAYVALTKPRIIELLLVTTVPTMVVAAKGLPGGWLVLATLVGGSTWWWTGTSTPSCSGRRGAPW
jgi:heme O synthase-like polyprenyltransferase